jgi:hypothetical protein
MFAIRSACRILSDDAQKALELFNRHCDECLGID